MTYPKIQHRDETDLSETFVTAWVEHRNRMRFEERPNDPATPPSEVIAQLQHLPPFFHLHSWSIEDDQGIPAAAQLQMSDLESNTHMAQLEISVEPHLRRQGLGTQLLRLAAECAKTKNRSLLIASSSDRVPAGADFLERYGFTKGLEHHVNQLDLNDVPPGLLAQWLETAPREAPEYEIGFWDGAYPEAELSEIAQLVEVMNSAPRGDLEINDEQVTPELIRQMEALQFAAGNRKLTAYARHRPTGAFAGFTELTWKPQRPGIVQQGGTGVFPQHRGHGLGKWLKAANLQRLLQENPEVRFVRTGNADSNAAMLRINQQIGFKPYFAAIAWQGQVAQILERLGNNRA